MASSSLSRLSADSGTGIISLLLPTLTSFSVCKVVCFLLETYIFVLKLIHSWDLQPINLVYDGLTLLHYYVVYSYNFFKQWSMEVETDLLGSTIILMITCLIYLDFFYHVTRKQYV